MDNFFYILTKIFPWVPLFVGAGLGLGWWIWGRLRDGIATGSQEDYLKLESDFKKKTKHWEARLKKAEGDADTLRKEGQKTKSELGRLKSERKNLRNKASDAESERDGLQSRIDMLERQASGGGELKARIGELEGGINKVRHERDLLKDKIVALERERDVFKTKYNEVEPKLGLLAAAGGGEDLTAPLQARISDLEGQLEAAKEGDPEVNAKISMLEEKLAAAEAAGTDPNRVANLEGQLAEASAHIDSFATIEADLKSARDKADSLEAERNILQNKLDGIEAQSVDFKRMAELEEQVAQANKQTEDATFALNQKVELLEGELREAQAASAAATSEDPRIGELQSQLEAANQKVAAAEQAAASAGDASAKIAELEGQLQAANDKASAAEQAAASAGDASAKIAELEGQLQAANDKASAAEQAAASAGDASAKIAELEGQLQAANDKASAAEQAAASAGDASAKIAELEGQLQAANDKVASAQESSASQIANLQAELSGASSKLGLLSGLESDKASLQTKISDLEAQLAKAKEASVTAQAAAADNSEVDGLNRRIAELEEKLQNELGKDHPSFGEPHKAAATVDYQAAIQTEFAGEDVRAEDKWGILYNGDPNTKDDLTKIKGVGPVLSGKLNDADVFRYKQIANWSDGNVRNFAERLESFPDRIERDRWIPQAKILAGEADSGMSEFAGEEVKTDETLGILYTSKPDTVDDLTRIKGVGPVIEEKLHDFGVYRFKQIANWKEKSVAAFAEKLATFPDRIDRDEWIAQAKDLAKEK